MAEADPGEKAAVFCELLTQDSALFLHVDARHPDVQLPENMLGCPHVVLQYGRAREVAIRDLVVDAAGIHGTLRFRNQNPFWCVIPWDAVFSAVSADDPARGWTWDPPPEAFAAAASQKRRTLPPGWAVIEGGAGRRRA